MVRLLLLLLLLRMNVYYYWWFISFLFFILILSYSMLLFGYYYYFFLFYLAKLFDFFDEKNIGHVKIKTNMIFIWFLVYGKANYNMLVLFLNHGFFFFFLLWPLKEKSCFLSFNILDFTFRLTRINLIGLNQLMVRWTYGFKWVWVFKIWMERVWDELSKVRFGYRWNGICVFYVFFFSLDAHLALFIVHEQWF